MNKRPLILSIETATNICSVCLSEGNRPLEYRECKESNAHSKKLSLLIDDIFKTYGKNIKSDLDIVAVSKGPGSYTGLRIGVSTAKGLAYGLNIPLIGVDTLSILAKAARDKHKGFAYMPMIDARRMEVYNAIYDENLKIVKPVSADIIEEDLYRHYHGFGSIVLVGDGAAKCREVLKEKVYIYDEEICLSAKDMAELAEKKYEEKAFEDVAYFEPYYLKDFIAKKSTVKGLY